MAEIIPFRGYTYNAEKTGKLSKLVTLPYDVISSALQESYYKASPYNVVRLEFRKGKSLVRYKEAGCLLNRWLGEGVLKQDNCPSYYVIEQSFTFGGKHHKRTGFYALIKALDFKKKQVLPHEETFPKHKKDRLLLLKACKANISPIFGVFDGKIDFEPVKKNKPDMDYSMGDKGQKVTGKIWKVTDGKETAKLSAFIRNRRVFIADGHHRYETAVNYRNEMQAKYGKDETAPWNYTMLVLVSMQDKGLVIYPTHRVVKYSSKINIDTLVAALGKDFGIKKCRKEDSAKDVVVFLNGKYFRLKPKSWKVIASIPGRKSFVWKSLSTSILHHLILPRLPEVKDIVYVRDESEGLKLVNSSGYDAMFLIPSISTKAIRETAVKLERMPQKSTYFYPKLPTGVVINKY